jgi:hypothetical protein
MFDCVGNPNGENEMNATSRKRRLGINTNVTLYAWCVPQTGEWVLTEGHRIAQWNKSQIKWVKVVREWSENQNDEDEKGSDRITQTITGQWAQEYVLNNLPMVRLISLTQTDDETTMIVTWTF